MKTPAYWATSNGVIIGDDGPVLILDNPQGPGFTAHQLDWDEGEELAEGILACLRAHKRQMDNARRKDDAEAE